MLHVLSMEDTTNENNNQKINENIKNEVNIEVESKTNFSKSIVAEEDRCLICMDSPTDTLEYYRRKIKFIELHTTIENVDLSSHVLCEICVYGLTKATWKKKCPMCRQKTRKLRELKKEVSNNLLWLQFTTNFKLMQPKNIVYELTHPKPSIEMKKRLNNPISFEICSLIQNLSVFILQYFFSKDLSACFFWFFVSFRLAVLIARIHNRQFRYVNYMMLQYLLFVLGMIRLMFEDPFYNFGTMSLLFITSHVFWSIFFFQLMQRVEDLEQ